MRRARSLCLLVAVAALGVGLVVAPGGAHAGSRGIDTETFRPALDGYGLFTVERTETAPRYDFGFQLFVDYAHEPLRLAMKDGAGAPAVRPLLDYQLATHLGAWLGVTSWLELAVEVPVSLQSFTAAFGRPSGGAGEDPLRRTGFYAADPLTNVPPPDASPLDVRVAVKARLLRAGPVGVALVLAGTAPFGDDSAFLGAGGYTLRPTAVVDVTLARGALSLALDAGAVVRRHVAVVDPADVARNATLPADRRTPPTTLVEAGSELTFAAGASCRVHRLVALTAELYGAVPLVVDATPGDRTPGARDVVLDALAGVELRASSSVALAVGGGAGLLGATANAAPGSVSSSRHDVFRLFAGLRYAPASPPVAAAPADRDGDGIPDDVDRCPDEPEDVDGFEDDDGCPDPDNDRDGIPDAQDRCPNEPETKNGYQDDDGCPDVPLPASALADAPVAVTVIFGPGSTRVTDALPALDQAVSRLRAQGERRVRLEGHVGAGERRELARARAEAVRDHLVRRGVDAARIEVVSAGAGGRRVELVWVQR